MPTVKDVVPMSESKTKPKSTRAGIALSADAISKLHRLADWMEEELRGQQNPQIKLSLMGHITTMVNHNVTHVTPMGALVQMYHPFKLTEARWVMPGMFTAEPVHRAPQILGIAVWDYYTLIGYIHKTDGMEGVIQQLRNIQ